MTRTDLFLPVVVPLLVVASCRPTDADPPLARVTRADLVQEVEVTGELKSSDSLAVAPPPILRLWEYKIAFLIEEGTKVAPGDTLVSFDTSKLEQDKQTTEADLSRTRQQLEQRLNDFALARENDGLALIEARARADKTTLSKDLPPDLVASLEAKKNKLSYQIAQEEVAFTETKSRSARQRETAEQRILQSQIARLQSALETINADLGRLVIKSPRAGVAIYEADDNGQKPKVGDTVWRGRVILEVATLERMYAYGQIAEVDISKIGAGQPVTLRLEAYQDIDYPAKIQRIDDTVNFGTVHADLGLARTDPLKMRPGMRFRGRIETGRVPRALSVPIDAVIPTADGPEVIVVDGKQQRPVRIKVGARNDQSVQILSGLAEGASVLRAPTTPGKDAPR
jgi:HlyD family secretion protein